MKEKEPLHDSEKELKNGGHKLLNEIKRKVNTASERFGMIREGDRILIGFSGGSDSALMLSVLSALPGIEVGAVHVHHGIRGEEADRDESFCRSFCGERSIPYYCVRYDVPSIAARDHTGIEETARRVRYETFDRLAAENGYNKIATAHNASDNTETLLFHLIRGASLEGLCGIPPVRGNIIRPLILCSKDEITSCCTEENIPFVTDSTNTDTAYSRNFLRCEIIPKMKQLNPSIDETVAAETGSLRTDRDFISQYTGEYSLENGRRELSALHDSVLHRVLKREFEKNGMSPLSVHLQKASELMRSERSNFRLSVPGGTFFCDRDSLRCGKDGTDFRDGTALGTQRLSFGTNILSDGSAVFISEVGCESSKEINKLKNIYKLSKNVSVNFDKINEITVRQRREGDSIVVDGMTRSVRKLLQQRKLTAKRRSTVPVFVLGGSIIWIPGFRAADSTAPGTGKNGYCIYYFTNDDF